MEKHSSHSFGTPLQPAYTSELLGAYKRRWGLRKRESKALVNSLPGLVFDREKILNSGKATLTCEDVESLCRGDPLRYTGEEIITVHSQAARLAVWLGSKLLIRNVWCHVLSQVSASCPKDCRCPPDTPRCAAGVSLMLDGCGCCKVCAQQLFEDCSQTQPCDHTKGLECNFGGGYGSAKGICRGTMTSVLLSSMFFFL